MLRLLLLAAFLLATVPFVPFVPSGHPERVLDTRRAPYYEDAAVPRPIASVLAELIDEAGTMRLRVTVSALGDEVDALPGLEGVHGANLRTAEELDRLLRDDELRFVLRTAGESVAGALVAVARDHLPARRIDADGRLELEAQTTAQWPVRATFVGPPLPEGASWSYLEADGMPRLAVACTTTANGGRIVAIESRGENRREVGEARGARR